MLRNIQLNNSKLVFEIILYLFIFAFIFSNLNKTFQITAYINLFKNIIVSLPVLICLINYKLTIKNKPTLQLRTQTTLDAPVKICVK